MSRLLKRTISKAKYEEGTYKFQLVNIRVVKGVRWKGQYDKEVLDLTFQFDNNKHLTQRFSFSFGPLSNLSALIKTITGELPAEDNDTYDADKIAYKPFAADLIHYQRRNGDVIDIITNFRNID